MFLIKGKCNGVAWLSVVFVAFNTMHGQLVITCFKNLIEDEI